MWRVDPRTQFLGARAGLSWTGVREYVLGGKRVKVLHRPEQFTAPGFLKTLRRLPAPEGHPDGGRDVLVSNADELVAGYTGEVVDVEPLGGYMRPVGNVSVFRASTICKMVDEATWRRYCEDFPDVAQLGLRHAGGKPRTGTSLGYNSLWYGPHVEAEIVSERDDGSYVGEWQGPNGPERYDIEHIVDPDCEIVQRLVTNTGFNPEILGGQHFAVCLAALGGRGAEQSELLRVVDSRELPIDCDQARATSRVALQVPRMPSVRDAKWSVGADRDLPIVPGDWDGDAAAASVFAWAGFDGDNPDPAKARRAFLIYDTDEPALKGSYKLPIAEYRDGGLVVIKGGMDAAASYLPQTDAPQDVLDRARDVLDRYYAKWEKQQPAAARDALPADREFTMTQTKTAVEIGFSRDAAKALAQRGITPPSTLTLAVTDMLDAEKLKSKVGEMGNIVGDLMEMLAEARSDMEAAKSEAEDAKMKMKDMMSVAEAEQKVAEMKAALAEAETQLAEAKTAEAQAKDEYMSMEKERDSLLSELEPLRAEQFDAFKAEAVTRGFDEAKVGATKDAAELRRLIVVERVGDRYGKARDDGSFVLDDNLVAAAFDGVWASMPAPDTSARTTDAAAPSTSPTFAGFPRVATQRDAAEGGSKPAPSTTKQELSSGPACL